MPCLLKHRPHGVEAQDGTVLGDKPARLPRVILTSLGTGRYGKLAVDAMESGVKFFGGDCEPSFHVLTDDISIVPSHLNPVSKQVARVREGEGECGVGGGEGMLDGAALPVAGPCP